MRTDSVQPSTIRLDWSPLLVVLVMLWIPTVVGATESIALSIRGVTGEARDNVEVALRLNQRRNDPDLDGDTIRELHASAEGEIRRALEPFGYYRPEIEVELVEPGTGQSEWRATYDIDPGEPVSIALFDARLLGGGAEDEEVIRLIRSFPLAEGDVLRHADYERGKNELIAEVRTQGYLKAELQEHRVEVDVEAYTANVILAVDTGPLHVVGPIVFDQPERNDPGSEEPRFAGDFLERYLILRPGEPINQSDVADQRRLLSRSGYFEEVLIEQGEATASAPPEIPLIIRLIPFKANRYRGQVGWGTDTGAGLQGDWNRRYLGRYGHRFIFGGSVVQDQSRLAGDLRYTIPLDPLVNERLELTARVQSRTLTFEDVELDEGGETRILNGLLSAYWHAPRFTFGDFQVRSRAGISVVRESYDIFEILFGNLPDSAQQAIISQIGQQAFDTLAPDFEAVVPSVRLSARRTDDDLYIRRGDYFNLEILGADTSIGSNIDFWQLRFDSWNIWPIGDSNRLLLRTAAGYSDAETRNVLGADFNRMPELYEFRAGGARSIRGYGFEELFPDNAILGGKHQLIASLEYEHEIIPDWSVAGFVDAGNAFNDFDKIDEKFGVGIGARWRSPVGVARVDVAFPLDDSKDSFQFYITVGPEF